MKFLERALVWVVPDKEPWIGSRSRVGLNQSDTNGHRQIEFTTICDYILSNVLWHAHELDSPIFRPTELSTLLQNFFQPISQGSSCFQGWSRLTAKGGAKVTVSTMRSYMGIVPLTPLQAMSTHGLFYTLRGLWEEAGSELVTFHWSTPSPLTLAIRHGHEPIWKFILLANAKVNNGAPGPLKAAIKCDNMEAFEALLEANADVNYVSSSIRNDPESPGKVRADTPLQAALWRSRKQSRKYFTQRLLDEGADVNLKTGAKTTLELSVQFADEEAVRMLLDANTKVYNPDHFLSLAAQNRNFNLVPLFVNLGANVKAPWEGVLPLIRALRVGNLSSIQSLLEMSGTSIDLACHDHREAILLAMWDHTGRYPYPRNLYPFVFGSNPHIDWMDCEADTIRALRSYPKYKYELRGLGFGGSKLALQCIEGTAHRWLSSVDTLLYAGPDPSVNVDFGPGRTLSAAAFHGRLHHVRALLDQEACDVEEKSIFSLKLKQGALFRTALLIMMSGHLGIVSRKSLGTQWPPFRNDCLCPKLLDVFQLLFDGDLDVYMPIYDSLSPLIPPVYINEEGYDVHNPCHLYVKDYFGCFSRPWLSVMWDLQNSTSPQLPLDTQLRQWQFPGILPPRCFIVIRMTALSRARPTYFIILSIVGNRSQFNIVSAPQRVREPLSQRSEDGRWKRYKPERFGFTRLPDPDDETESWNTNVRAEYGKFKANAVSSYRNMFVLVLLAFVVGFLSYFLEA